MGGYRGRGAGAEFTMTHKITFVHAPLIQYDQNYGVTLNPLWAYTLAAYVPAGWDVEIIDREIDDPMKTGPADVFAFSGMNKDIDSIRVVHDDLKAKYPDAAFILGGPMTWSMDQEGKLDTLLYFDHVFILDGEETLPDFLERFAQGTHGELPQVIRAQRFPVGRARKVRFDLIRETVEHYYGALIEVSRGCPFLCEFCDVRVLPGNNRSNNKNPQLIVEELDAYYKLGVRQFQFVCDNFIGDVSWARQCVDAILEWKEQTGAEVSIFTWITVNLYKLPDLMAKMRRAGFSIIYIGIESVNQNALLETAKAQNFTELGSAITEIQSYGFVIVPGFIFGFDSDTESVFDDTLDFFIETGLIGGEPAFLMALSGTPLYKRMERSGRLVERIEDKVIVRKGNRGASNTITTNILYLLDADFLARGLVRFLKIYNSPAWQLERYKRHLKLLERSENFIAGGHEGGYATPREYFRFQFKDPNNRKMLFLRIAYVLHKPTIALAILKAWWLTKRLSRRFAGLDVHFNYWGYVWTNMGLKYWNLREEDIQLQSVGQDFDLAKIAELPVVEDDIEAKKRGDEKTVAQDRLTRQGLKALAESRTQGTAAASGAGR